MSQIHPKTYILPQITPTAKIIKKILEISGRKVFYRGVFYPELMSDKPTDVFFLSTRAFTEYIKEAIRPEVAQKLAAQFSLNPDLLSNMGRELMRKEHEYEFAFVNLIARGRLNIKARNIVAAPGRLRRCMAELLGLPDEDFLTALFSMTQLCLKKIALGGKIFLKIGYSLSRLLVWKFQPQSETAGRMRDQFLWLPGGPDEISLNAEELSLPLYLKEIAAAADLKKKFAVLCPFADLKERWNHGYSFAVPHLRDIPPGLGWFLFWEGVGNLLHVFFRTLFVWFRLDEELELLSLLPFLLLDRIWFKCVPVKALFITESCAGAACPLVQAAREEGVPVVMVFYSANVSPEVLNRDNAGIIPIEFQYMSADEYCVWTQDMKDWLIGAGYSSEKVHVVGPQMFAPVLRKHSRRKPSGRIKIGFFEITPLHPGLLLQWGKGESIKNMQYSLAFRKSVYEIVHQVFGEDFEIIVKAKRRASASRFVADWAKNLESVLPGMKFHVVEKDPNANPWLVLDETDIVIATPFTSLGVAALAMGKPAVYFDPSRLILPRSGDQVPLFSEPGDLKQWLGQFRNNNQARHFAETGVAETGQMTAAMTAAAPFTVGKSAVETVVDSSPADFGPVKIAEFIKGRYS